MKNLVCVVADKQIKATIEALLQRPHALGIRDVEAEVLLHPNHDPGCYDRPTDLLRGYRHRAEHALLILDLEWDGVPAESGPELEALIDDKLSQADMADWAAPLVIEPELETWVFSTSPHVSTVLGWKGPSSIRRTLQEQNLWTAEDAKPADPKAALEYILGRTGKSRSSSLFRRLASRVGTAGCQDRAFLRLKTLLQGWFPPVAPTSGDDQPDGPFTQGANTVEYETRTRRKLIEVALPLDAINAASAREKSIRHGHPSTLHLWWARRPLAAARAVIFAQMVDDPSANPALFPTERAQEEERERLFGIIRELVKWENTTNEEVLERARREIQESWVRTCSENADHPRAAELFDPDRLPAFHDPFAGGGALPLEAQRLGLEAYASDLNPVAVLINKAMIEIPPKFAGRPPVNPESRAEQTVIARTWHGAQGLAADVGYYGRWVRDEAEKRIGHLYPKIEITPAMVRERADLKRYEGRKLTVIAWLWARTVKSPNPAFAHADVPLASTFMLSTKKGKEAYVEPVVEHDRYRFAVKVGKPANLEAANTGTKLVRGANFWCLMSHAPISGDYIKAEGKAGRIGTRMMAIIAEGDRSRVYLPPALEMEGMLCSVEPEWRPMLTISGSTQYIGTKLYGMERFDQLFTERQLAALTTFADLVTRVREEVRSDILHASGRANDDALLEDGDAGWRAYSEAVGIYLAFAIDKGANYWSSLCAWHRGAEKMVSTFGRQALPIVWDYAEANPFSDSSGNFLLGIEQARKMVRNLGYGKPGVSVQADCQSQNLSVNKVISTDPPYFDSVPYADLSDYFYAWLRRSIRSILPDLFSTVAVPKTEELVAFAYRHGGKEKAKAFFLDGMTRTMQRLAEHGHTAFPVTIYYAFRQQEVTGNERRVASTAWDTFLQATIRAGFSICGTWPVRTEYTSQLKTKRNALASSIVLVCRRRSRDAAIASRREFLAALRSELPPALSDLQTSNIAPVDLAQAAIGPGMAIFTRHARVLEADGSPMSVRSALVEINRMLDETLAKQEGDLDADTRFCVAWYEQYGMAERAYGEAEVLFSAKNTSFEGLRRAGVIMGGKGKVRIVGRDELAPDWEPAMDQRITDWECTQHLTRALTAERGGGVAEAARLVLAMGASRADKSRSLGYRLYAVADRKGWADDANAYNILVTSWPQIQTEAARLGAGVAEQAGLGFVNSTDS